MLGSGSGSGSGAAAATGGSGSSGCGGGGGTATSGSLSPSTSAAAAAAAAAQSQSAALLGAASSDPNSVVMCKFCAKSFPDVTSLITHLSVHTGDRPFKCEFCGKAFKLRHHMKDHCRVHTGKSIVLKVVTEMHISYISPKSPFSQCFFFFFDQSIFSVAIEKLSALK